MTDSVQQYPFVQRDLSLGPASLAPMLPLILTEANRVVASGLLDTGATVNVLPFTIGQRLGFDWDLQTTAVQLSGNLASAEARVVVVSAEVGNFASVRLAFAWARTEVIPVLLGQVNFFMEFDVCFFRSRELFEVRPRQDPGKVAAASTR